MSKLVVFLLLICIVFTETLGAKNPYCAAGLCPKGKPHIACGNNGRFALRCPNNAKMVPLGRHQKQILHLHNSKRNLIASGRLSGFKAAERMATMQWDDELAKLAALNVKQCIMRHDKCRNTRRFANSGQNLAMITYGGLQKSRSNSALIRNRVSAWWKEFKNANMNIINKYPKNYSGPPVGHFTVFVADKNIRLGCAASRFTKRGKHSFLIACNYATTNLGGEPVYRAGNAASGCKTGRNSKYPKLCSKNERYSGLS